MDWTNVTAEDLVEALREVDWSPPPRPFSEFFSRFTVPRCYAKWNSRLKCNLYYYRRSFSFLATFSEKVTRTLRQFSPHLAAKLRAPLAPVIWGLPSAKRAIHICGRPRWRKVEKDGKLMPELADVDERELFEALNLELESDLDVDRMRHYEVVYLIHEDQKDEVENVNIKVREFLEEKKGKVWRFSDWGMRRLAYQIKKAKNAHYILMNFELEARWINDFKSLLDRDERVIRHLVMKQDKAETRACPPPPEFHTLRADMVDDEDTNEEEYDDEDLEDEGEDDEGIIYVDDVEEESSSSVRNTRKPEKVGR